jgi:rhomboid protease GluP
MNDQQYQGSPEPAPSRQEQGIPIPLSKPIITNTLLVLIGIYFVLEFVVAGSDALNSGLTPAVDRMLTVLGGELGTLVAAGQYWRLLTAMFIHLGLLHLAFNGWALYIFGREVEAFYGSPRYAVIYVVSGLFGNVVSYIWGNPDVWSAGASGAIFGLVGADVAFFLINRKALGRLSQRQLVNLGILVAINLAIGFVPGIDWLAHLGGLVSGFVLGLGLSPRYSAVWEGWAPRLVNKTSATQGVFVVGVVCLLLVAGVALGNQKWSQPARISPGEDAVVPASHVEVLFSLPASFVPPV